MKEIISLLLILNVAFSGARFLRRRERWKVDSESSSNPDSEASEITVEPYLFSQKLDHFDPSNDQKWSQRYWFSNTYYEDGGPIFLLINGEWSVDDANGGFDGSWVSYAKSLNALCFSLEHRFYGSSWPEKNNMRYLSTAQALSDIANFITVMTKEIGLDRHQKWIVFGCSYPAVLAAWARLKYPHLIHGAVASSAPLISKVDYDDYSAILERSLKTYDPKCVTSITQASEEIAHFIDSTENIKNISRLFGFCDKYDKSANISDVKSDLFFEMIRIFSDAVQGNDTTSTPIPLVCDIMINHNGTKGSWTRLEAFAELLKTYNKANENYTEDSWNQKAYGYQVCSEIGGFVTNGDKTVSLFNLSKILPTEKSVKKQCEQFFGPNFGVREMNEKMDHANMLYGGLNFNVGNTLFVHGSLDPWHTYGLYQTTKGSLFQTIFIKGTSHCGDYEEDSDKDIRELKEARKKVLNILKIWLKKLPKNSFKRRVRPF